MKRQRNTSCAYTGKVGAKLRPRLIRGYSRRLVKHLVTCQDGPWRGYRLCLTTHSDFATLPIVIRGEAGRYVFGVWRPAEP